MQSGAFLDTVISYSVLRQGILTSCALTSSRLDDFFRYSYLYTVMITKFCGEAGRFFFSGGGGGGGELLPLKYPR